MPFKNIHDYVIVQKYKNKTKKINPNQLKEKQQIVFILKGIKPGRKR